MILVIAWSTLLIGLALVVAETVVRQIRPSAHSEYSYAALAAAEAGVDDYRARLLVKADYFLQPDSSNVALGGWAPVPGGNTNSEFTYAIDSSRAGAGGDLRVFVTGRSPRGAGGVTRTLEALYSKRSTLDYTYMSDKETTAPDLPNAYSTASGTGITNPTSNPSTPEPTAQELAGKLCTKYWYTPDRPADEPPALNLVGAPTLANWNSNVFPHANYRNTNFCMWAQISSGERLLGKVHTNDIWRLKNELLTSTFEPGFVTSACPDATTLVPGCKDDAHRFLPTTIGSNYSPTQTWAASGSAVNVSTFPWNGTSDTGVPIRWEERLALPLTSALLKTQAATSGCVYTGPTRILFGVDATLGAYMWVTSPDTVRTNPHCDGATDSNGTALYDTTAPHTSAKVWLSQFKDLVIYVQNGTADAPSCAVKFVDPAVVNSHGDVTTAAYSSQFPFVVPSDTSDADLFNGAAHFKGFPDEYAKQTSPWYGKSTCHLGDLYVQGRYGSQVTIATENNIVLTGNLVDGGAPWLSTAILGSTMTPVPTSNTKTDAVYTGTYVNYGKPNPSSSNNLGLVSDKFTYVYRPAADGSPVNSWKTSNTDNLTVNAAILAIQQCWAVQDPTLGAAAGYLRMWGSIAQNYRCTVGTASGSRPFDITHGYSKAYRYDSRLGFRTPPYMLKLSDDPWSDSRMGEVNPAQQGVGATINYSLVPSDEPGGAISDVTLSTGPGTCPGSPTNCIVSGSGNAKYVPITATGAGLIVVTYALTPSGSSLSETRRVVILAN